MGYSVSVYESKNKHGGKLAELQLGDYRFDLGPSLFTMPELVTELFHLYGESPDSKFNYVELEETCHYYFDEHTKMRSYSDIERYEEEIKRNLGINDIPLKKYFNEVNEIYDITNHIFLEKSLHKLKSFLNYKTFQSILRLYRLKMNQTLSRYNRSFFNNSYVEKIFNRFATYNGSNPFECPATLRVIPHLEQNIGTFFPIKGMRSIIDALHAFAVEKGVLFHFEQQVKQIKVENKRATGIIVNGKFIEADIVVSNADVNFTYEKLLSSSGQRHKALRNPLSSSAIIFYWGLDIQSELGVHNILFSEDYESEFQEIFKDKSAPNDPTVYIHISSKIKKDDAPASGENWFVMVNTAPNENQDWDLLIQKTRKAIIAKINSYLKVDIEKHLQEEYIRDPRILEEEAGAFRGALYGSNSNSILSAFLRHPNFSSKIKGLYFCGGTVHPGGGIPLCLLSAKITSALIQEDYR